MVLIECELTQILISENSAAQVIVLQERNGDKKLSIEIGFVEAMSINSVVHGLEYTRPITHDLVHTLLETLSTEIKHIIISDLRPIDNSAIYYGLLVLNKDGEEIILDCRPSDAIALAVRCGCKIFVSKEVLDIAAHK